MKFRFIGTHTGGRDSITMGGVTFTGSEPADVDDADLSARLSNNPEFEAVGKRDPLDHDGDGKKGGSASGRDGDQQQALKLARSDYLAKFGKKAFNGWDEATIREKIAAA